MKLILYALWIGTLVWTSLSGAQSEIVTIPSKSMGKKFKATIIIPDSYKKTGSRYSIIYLLHGYSGDYTSWTRIVPLNDYSDKYQLIFVCADGNYNSWYIDSPKKSSSFFETYITSELVMWIDSTYKTIGSFKGRALIGSSMGGHGAVTLLFSGIRTNTQEL